jgi:hypothetical protein
MPAALPSSPYVPLWVSTQGLAAIDRGGTVPARRPGLSRNWTPVSAVSPLRAARPQLAAQAVKSVVTRFQTVTIMAHRNVSDGLD